MKMQSALAALFLAGSCGLAMADTVVIKPEQETVIREYVDRQATASVDLPGVDLSIGVDLPDTVEVHTIDAPDVKYRYAVVGGKTYVVEPESRKIVHIIN